MKVRPIIVDEWYKIDGEDVFVKDEIQLMLIKVLIEINKLIKKMEKYDD